MYFSYIRQVLLEALVIGTVFTIAGSLASRLSMLLSSNPPIDIWNIEWNSYYQLESVWFVTAALLHLIFEMTGLNAWYGKNGAAMIFSY